MIISGKTRVLGIIGSPVGHSLSPVMQNAAIAELGIDYVYVPFPVEPDYLGEAVEGLRRLGVWGFNVTIPHKSSIIPLLDRIAPEAGLCGAVNTVCREGDQLVGYNTDGVGFLASARAELGFEPGGSKVLILGAGGAARGAVASLAKAGVAEVIIANRTRERGVSLAEDFQAAFPGVRLVVSSLAVDELEGYFRGVDLLVNTTSVGMNGTKFESLPLSALRSCAKVYDMVYVPAETPLLASAKKRELACANGIGMLVSQGEAAFSLWTGEKPPYGVMRQKLLERLER
ncbi:MAG TPA: shikimate dehydrogenase [Geobacteraceae bacterium]|nr:shikimate dehydrogenase [Geobacteraceae bacterium]